ncbi:MAG: glycosyltransferase family 4 protein [Pseudomonadota bacterium]
MTFRVLQIISPTGFYGAERWVMALANNLDSRVRCDLAVLGEDDRSFGLFDTYPRAGSVTEFKLASSFDLSIVSKLVDFARDHDIALLHSHGYKSDIITALVALRSRIPIVSTPHGFGEVTDKKLRLYHWLGKVFLRSFDRVVPLSPKLLEDLQPYVAANKLSLISNGVDLKDIDASVAAAPKRVDQRPTLGFVGRLDQGKQVDQIIRVFAQLKHNFPDARLCLIGEGPLRGRLEHLATDLGCNDAIEFLGFRSDRIELMLDFDVFVLASESEGIPRSLMEAHATRTAVVAYDIPGVDLVVDHGESGLLAPLNDVDALRAHCERLLGDACLRQSLAGAGRAKVEREYSAAAMAQQYTELYAGILESKR